MEKAIKQAVSGHRKRYTTSNFDLDLTYIMPNIIAMGFPAENVATVYQNDINDVARFLNQMHGGYYKVYNLTRRSFDARKFQFRVAHYPITDSNPPRLTMMKSFCEDVDQWLTINPRNVVVVNCNAGKGRTGTMICAYLLYKRIFRRADEAVAHFEEKRLQPGARGIRPGQVRYVRYFERLIRENFVYYPKPLLLYAVQFSENLEIVGMPCSPCFTVRQSESRSVFRSRTFSPKPGERNVMMKLKTPIIVSGDVKITFYHKQIFAFKKQLFWMWFNTYFVGNTLEERYNMTTGTGIKGFLITNQHQLHHHHHCPLGDPTQCHDGSRPGSAFLVSVVNVGASNSVGGLPSGRSVTVTMPGNELDRNRPSSITDVVAPEFTVKVYFTTVPDM